MKNNDDMENFTALDLATFFVAEYSDIYTSYNKFDEPEFQFAKEELVSFINDFTRELHLLRGSQETQTAFADSVAKNIIKKYAIPVEDSPYGLFVFYNASMLKMKENYKSMPAIQKDSYEVYKVSVAQYNCREDVVEAQFNRFLQPKKDDKNNEEVVNSSGKIYTA